MSNRMYNTLYIQGDSKPVIEALKATRTPESHFNIEMALTKKPTEVEHLIWGYPEITTIRGIDAIRFETNWTAPLDVVILLAQQFPKVLFSLTFQEEINPIAGVMQALNDRNIFKPLDEFTEEVIWSTPKCTSVRRGPSENMTELALSWFGPCECDQCKTETDLDHTHKLVPSGNTFALTCGGFHRLQDDRDYFLLEQERDVHFIICPQCSVAKPPDSLCAKGQALIKKCVSTIKNQQEEQ